MIAMGLKVTVHAGKAAVITAPSENGLRSQPAFYMLGRNWSISDEKQILDIKIHGL
jgi:hypothetical protein